MSSPIPTHMPAMKVGGRRLSVGNRHKKSESTSKDAAKETDPATPPDYPRPKEGEEGQTEQAEEHEQQDEQAKKKRAEFTPDHVVKRDGQWADNSSRKKGGYGGGGRISQPAGKGFAS